MNVVAEQIGGATVLIEVVSDEIAIVNAGQHGPDIVDTGIEEAASAAYGRLKTILKAVVEDLGSELGSLKVGPNARPKQLEVAFSLGFSAQFGAWIIGAGGQHALNVTVSWNLEADG